MFHLLLNLILGLLHVHYGTINVPGGLAFYFALLKKVQLDEEHPDFHTLLTALTQILDSLLLNAWRQECAADDHIIFTNFLATAPTPEKLLKYVHHIL